MKGKITINASSLTPLIEAAALASESTATYSQVLSSIYLKAEGNKLTAKAFNILSYFEDTVPCQNEGDCEFLVASALLLPFLKNASPDAVVTINLEDTSAVISTQQSRAVFTIFDVPEELPYPQLPEFKPNAKLLKQISFFSSILLPENKIMHIANGKMYNISNASAARLSEVGDDFDGLSFTQPKAKLLAYVDSPNPKFALTEDFFFIANQTTTVGFSLDPTGVAEDIDALFDSEPEFEIKVAAPDFASSLALLDFMLKNEGSTLTLTLSDKTITFKGADAAGNEVTSSCKFQGDAPKGKAYTTYFPPLVLFSLAAGEQPLTLAFTDSTIGLKAKTLNAVVSCG